MYELLAVVNGFLLGAVAGQYQATTRLRLVLLTCIMGGVVATMAARYAQLDSALLLLDFLLVAVSAAIGLFSARRLTVRRHG